ncbi:MAG TPA: ComF family protein [Arenimonas sp.]|uniref:ComF family protein n=1 Tax=Arenimonas sp. TaxID=1872635 RepID=UPI002D7FBEE1|nr:ComF family protein [Arenimonas sp.]HEU0153449.1 ComF family protein [Arenimonas sp.]
MSWPVRFSQWLGRALLPPRCLVCTAPGADDRDLCGACRDALPWSGPACPRCALPTPAGRGRGCGRCLARAPPLDATLAVLAYRFPVDRLLLRFKFHGDLAAGRLLAQLMASALPARLAGAPPPAAVVPVPLHPGRLRQRGYDQARELARPVAAALGLPLHADALHRVRATEAQTRLDAAGRRGNVRRAFACRRGALPAHVVLLDDVMTTGATLGECARALRRAGVRRVDAWVVARAPPPGRGDQPSA